MFPSRHDSYNPDESYDKYEHCQKQQDHREEPLAVQSGHKIPVDQHPDRHHDGDRTYDLNEGFCKSQSMRIVQRAFAFFF